MSEIQSIVDIKLFLSFIAVLLSSNIALIVFIAKKYIKRADKDHELLKSIATEHKVFHKNETGINS